jgi:hypothetical protein
MRNYSQLFVGKKKKGTIFTEGEIIHCPRGTNSLVTRPCPWGRGGDIILGESRELFTPTTVLTHLPWQQQ